MIRRLLVCLLLVLVIPAASAALAAPIDTIRALAGRQAHTWRGIVIDLAMIMPYYEAGGAPLWTRGLRPGLQAQALIEAFSTAAQDGLARDDYLRPALADPGRLADDADAAGYELAMSAAFMAFARDLHSGRTSPSVNAPDIVIARKPIRPVDWLSIVATAGVAKARARIVPQHVQYAQLRQMLAGYSALARRGGWPGVADGPSLKPGTRSLRVAQMRANLEARGYAGLDAGSPDTYDSDLQAAVEHFQTRHGLDADGVAGPGTLKAMNVTAEERVRQIVVNLERWRWLPDRLGARHVFVNQAAFEMFLIDKSKEIDRRRVIVGLPFHKTPIFSDMMTYADFNPTWTVTPAIAKNEFLPKLRKDPGYLARNDYTLYASWGENAAPLDPWTVDWHGLGNRMPYKIVQNPGAKNALGVVKFMFPNSFNIYLHDTPSRQLFARTGRAFSHGCIRVHRPLEFAEKLFRIDQNMPRAKIDQIVGTGKLTRVKLKTGVPVHLTYFTTWIDDDGTPYFHDDVYKRDDLVSRLLFGSV